MVFPLVPSTANFLTFAATSAVATGTLLPTARYAVTTDAAVMIAQGAAPVAAKADGSTLLSPGGLPLLLDGANGAKVAAIQAGGSGGQITITRVKD